MFPALSRKANLCTHRLEQTEPLSGGRGLGEGKLKTTHHLSDRHRNCVADIKENSMKRHSLRTVYACKRQPSKLSCSKESNYRWFWQILLQSFTSVSSLFSHDHKDHLAWVRTKMAISALVVMWAMTASPSCLRW